MLAKNYGKVFAIICALTMPNIGQVHGMNNQQQVKVEVDEPACPICYEPYNNVNTVMITYPCNHDLCIICGNDILTRCCVEKNFKCHMCRKEILVQDLKKLINLKQKSDSSNSPWNLLCCCLFALSDDKWD